MNNNKYWEVVGNSLQQIFRVISIDKTRSAVFLFSNVDTFWLNNEISHPLSYLSVTDHLFIEVCPQNLKQVKIMSITGFTEESFLPPITISHWQIAKILQQQLKYFNYSVNFMKKKQKKKQCVQRENIEQIYLHYLDCLDDCPNLYYY